MGEEKGRVLTHTDYSSYAILVDLAHEGELKNALISVVVSV